MNSPSQKLVRRPSSRKPVACSILVTGLTLASQAVGSALDWPQFLGPRHDNTSDETGLVDRWTTNGPAQIWEKTVGSGYSAPSVLGGLLVLHHRIGDQEIVEAMDAATGKSKWQHKDTSRFRDPFGYSNGPRCTPLLTSNFCYTFGAEGKLTCLSLADGKMVWQRDTAKDWNVPEAFFGVGSTPILEGGKLIVMVGGQPDSGVVALDPATGKTIWESVGSKNWSGVSTLTGRAIKPYVWTGSEMLASYASPIAATIHGQRHLLCFTRQGLVSLNPTNGEVRFSRWFQSPVNESVNAMTPVVKDDVVLISASYYRIGAVALRVNPDGRSYDEIWRSPINSYKRDPVTGDYPEPVLEVHFNTPVLHGGFLYAFSGRDEPDATFRCVELKSGRLMWSRNENWQARSKEQPPVYGRGSAILVDGKIIVLGEGGKLGMFQINSAKPEELCSWQVPQMRYPCWAGPVLAQKRLYLRSEDKLLCFNLGKPD